MTGCVPGARLAIWHCATPEGAGTALQPGSAVPLAMKATVPAITPVDAGGSDTVAVRIVL